MLGLSLCSTAKLIPKLKAPACGLATRGITVCVSIIHETLMRVFVSVNSSIR
jgi:hypothetical protein